MIDRLVQATIEVDEGVGSPQAACQFLACDELARLLQQRQQDVEGLIAKRSSTAAPSELARTNVDSKCPEMIDPRGLDAIRHRPNPGECARSEERRVGKECRGRWCADHAIRNVQ